jgi:hypothetical protein
MSLPVRRSIKNPTGIRRNFVSRDWTSIGLRGARVTLGKARTRTKLGSPDSELSYAHREDSRSIGLREPARHTTPNSGGSPRSDWRGLLWIALILFAIAAAAAQAIGRST